MLLSFGALETIVDALYIHLWTCESFFQDISKFASTRTASTSSSSSFSSTSADGISDLNLQNECKHAKRSLEAACTSLSLLSLLMQPNERGLRNTASPSKPSANSFPVMHSKSFSQPPTQSVQSPPPEPRRLRSQRTGQRQTRTQTQIQTRTQTQIQTKLSDLMCDDDLSSTPLTSVGSSINSHSSSSDPSDFIKNKYGVDYCSSSSGTGITLPFLLLTFLLSSPLLSSPFLSFPFLTPPRSLLLISQISSVLTGRSLFTALLLPIIPLHLPILPFTLPIHRLFSSIFLSDSCFNYCINPFFVPSQYTC